MITERKFRGVILFLLLTFVLATEGMAAGNWLVAREHLGKLSSRGRMDWADYQDDFLISQSADLLSVDKGEVIRRLRAQHAKTRLAIRGTYAKSGTEAKDLNFENFPLPREAIASGPLAACKLEKCAYKLNTESETRALVQGQAKVSVFHHLILDRLKRYLLGKELKGYEKRNSNVPFFKKALGVQKFIPALYPKSVAFLLGDFWTGAKSAAAPGDSYLRAELIPLSSDKTQPVYRLTENLEFEEDGRYLNLEIAIYTNHYFDSSLRLFEIFPFPENRKQTVFIVTDLMEIDELKKSALIRTLFKSTMEEAVAKIRKAEMSEVRG